MVKKIFASFFKKEESSFLKKRSKSLFVIKEWFCVAFSGCLGFQWVRRVSNYEGDGRELRRLMAAQSRLADARQRQPPATPATASTVTVRPAEEETVSGKQV
jgi:hypothetical protein